MARRINEILHGQERIFAGNPDIDKLAINFAQKIIRKYKVEYQDTEETYLNVNIDTVSHTTNRTIGGEDSCYSYLK